MIAFLSQPWPWWVSGPLIATVMFGLLIMGRSFGVSATLRTFCSIGGAGKVAPLFQYDWRKDRWNLLFIGGAVVGGILAGYLLPNPSAVAISEATQATLAGWGISSETSSLAPAELFGEAAFASPLAWFIWIVGGFCIGFGTRWAGGCTSGHAITGLSNLQWPSLVAVVGFFGGGMLAAHLLLPWLFSF